MYDVLVAGGSGFIGAEVARHISMHGLKVCTLDVVPPKQSTAQIGIPHIVCDITDWEGLRKQAPDAALIIHTAVVQIPRINDDRRVGYKVNVLGTENLCALVHERDMRGLVLAGSWHIFGESGLNGHIDERYGYRPDKVEDRARFYALTKTAQEIVVRAHAEMSEKAFGVLRLGTVLGEGMPAATAANIFINQALEGKEITPFRHSMYRPIMYVSVRDVVEAFLRYSKLILTTRVKTDEAAPSKIVNLLYPTPLTVLELATLVQGLVRAVSDGTIQPKVRVVDKGLPMLFGENDRRNFSFDPSQSRSVLGLERLISPSEELERIIRLRMHKMNKMI